ncbi:MAG: universal stress protein [Tissierellia bacterium]|nr:universal stress protein [Tissierellia bacterium]MDD4781331.1 universal stress protein [Tissierellia bacterium]
MKKILVPIDGSKASQKAAEKAISLAKEFGYEVKFISVVNVPTDDKYAIFGVNVQTAFNANRKEMLKELMEKETKMLNRIIKNLDASDVKVEQVVIAGIPYEEILKVAKEENFDIIVMGRRGFSNIERFFIGSVTQRVIAGSTCPVLVVNE